MAEIIREPVTPVYENTTMQKIYVNGEHRQFSIAPVSGYVLHDNTRDWTDLDPETMEEILIRGYATGYVTCAASYDFTENPREFYAVPADQIFGGGDDHVTA